MKRLTAYTILIFISGVALLLLAHRAQTQTVSEEIVPQETIPEQTAPEVAVGGSASPVFSYQGQLLDAQGNPVTGNVPMIFRLYATATGGTACWTENHTNANAVAVQGGRFSVLLGSITPANADCLADSPYLELRINNETLTPRQLLTDAIVSNGSQLGTTIIGRDLSFDLFSERGRIVGPENSALHLISDNTPLTNNGTWYRGSWVALSSIDNSVFPGSVRINIAKDNNLGNSPVLDVIRVQNDGVSEELMKVDENGNLNINRNLSLNGDVNGVGNLYGNTGQQIHMPSGGNSDIYINWGSGGGFHFGGGTATSKVYFNPNGDVSISGNLNIGGTCNASIEGDDVAAAGETCTAVRIGNGSIQTGGIIESNLMTPEERAAGVIDRFAQGDLLCWSAADMRLEKCTQANDRLVQAVADKNGLPIVAGAEPIKVIGPVQAGDYLVASSVPGYAIATPDPTFGIVIAQALEDFNGERGLILTFIRKM
jgi:hypothetical protein